MKKIIKTLNLSFPVCRSGSHAVLCYIVFPDWRLEVYEGIPGLISHPRVRLGVQSWYAVAVMKLVFSGAKPFFFFVAKANQPQCD